MVGLTQNRATLVLFPTPFRHVAGHSQVDNGEVFHSVGLRIKPTNDGKAATMVDVIPNLVQLLSEVRKRESLPSDCFAVEIQPCFLGTQPGVQYRKGSKHGC